jgi:hypothetical protein
VRRAEVADWTAQVDSVDRAAEPEGGTLGAVSGATTPRESSRDSVQMAEILNEGGLDTRQTGMFCKS